MLILLKIFYYEATLSYLVWKMTASLNIPLVRVNGITIPRALLGTSPFIAAGQFGTRSLQYYYKFVINTKNIGEIVRYGIKKGLKGIQLLTYDFVAREVFEACKELKADIIIVPTYVPDEPNSLDWILRFKAELAILHASISDRLSDELLGEHIDLLRAHGLEVGIATHTPYRTLNWLIHESVNKDKVRFILAPLNYAGLFIDTTLSNIEKLYRTAHEKGYKFIFKKVLGAGKLDIRKALKYVYSRPYTLSTAIGIASIEEFDYTFNIASELIRE